MLLTLAKITKLGGGTLTFKVQKNKTVCHWEIEPTLVVELEKDKRRFAAPYITRINNTDILSNIHGKFPSLCYNSILKKWFCVTRDTTCTLMPDAFELKRLKQKYERFDETNGFCDCAIDAIARWNVSTALELMAFPYEDIYE